MALLYMVKNYEVTKINKTIAAIQLINTFENK